MGAAEDPYAAIAAWYDVEHDVLTEDVECYAALMAAPESGRARVLEIGSGTGRIAARLAAAGHEVLGVEPSPAMRARCAARLATLPERVRRRVRMVAGSATDPGLEAGETFDVALFGLNTFAHLTGLEERHAALLQAARHLSGGGQVLLDVDLVGPRKLAESGGLIWWQGHWTLDATGTELIHTVAGTPGEEPGTVVVRHIYDAFTQGGPVTRTTATMTLALLTYGEVAGALARAGFHIAAAYGDYDHALYDANSARLILDARYESG
jgi:SAM-dependent methyltransferase